MYVEFFGLRELPFNNTPDPRFFFSTPDHEEALASLIYAVQQRKGFVLLTGEIGAGKTLVSRMMLRHFNGGIEFATINHAVESAGDLMEAVCTELQLPIEPGLSHTQLVRRLHDFLLAKFAQNVPVVLVLDEAQNLPIAAFEQLRMIGNLESDDAKLLQICIVGQPELQQVIQSPQVRQLRQRIFRSFHLPALDRPSTDAYIRHRLTVAGATDCNLFSMAAIDAIFKFSGGVPRLINAVCDNSLLSAYSAGTKPVSEEIVSAVISGMMVLTEENDQAGRFGTGQLHQAPCDAVTPTICPPLAGQFRHTEIPAAEFVGSLTAELTGAGQRAELLLQRLQAESIALQQREDRFRELSTSMRGVAAELARALSRMQRVAEQNRQAEASAREIQSALAGEADRASRILGDLRDFQPAAARFEGEFDDQQVSAAPFASRNGRVLRNATLSRAAGVGLAPMSGLMEETGHAIRELRGVTGRPTIPGQVGTSDQAACTDRLARQAEKLLTLLNTTPG